MYERFEEKAREILSRLSLKEKVGQLNLAVMPCDGQLDEYKERLRRGEIGAVILTLSATAGNDEQKAVVTEMLNDLQRCAIEESAAGIPLLYGRDVIHGHHTVYPIPLASAYSFNPELLRECYRCVAEDAASEGTNWTFAPMMDLCHEPRWGRIIETTGEDPYLSAKFAEAAVKGFQGEDMTSPYSLLACAKHYLGYGASEGGRDYNRTELSDYTLYNNILPAFRAAVKAGVGSVMSSFNDINGEPVTSSKKYLTDMLRGHLGFEGFVVSDWYSVDQLKKQGIAETDADCTRLSVTAGLDMDMSDEHYSRELEDLVTSGKVPMEVVDEAVLRILKIKLAKGLFDNPYADPKRVDRAYHVELAEKMAAESMVLLKNKNNALPLSKNATISVCGPFLDELRGLHGSWALDGYLGASTPTFRQAMEQVAGEGGGTLYMPYGEAFNNSPVWMFPNGEAIVLALGESHTVTGEARSMSDIALSEDQIELARKAHASGKKVIGVIFCGRPLALETVEPYLDAILIAWHGGTRAAHAAARTIYGDYNPSGRAAVTFVRRTGHIPLYYNVTASGREVDGYYGERPERCYSDCPASPLYPFGYGLSYTSFAYGEPTVNKSEMALSDLCAGEKFNFTVNVKNTGETEGKETVQLYIRDLRASYMRPLRELKAFEKISLSAGEEKTVSFDIGYDDLGYYTPYGEYIVEAGRFEIYIGENCLTKNKLDIVLK